MGLSGARPARSRWGWIDPAGQLKVPLLERDFFCISLLADLSGYLFKHIGVLGC